jgi:hypothetical protein
MAKKPTAGDYNFGQLLGEGAFARVVHAKNKETGKEYAVKIMEKKFIGAWCDHVQACWGPGQGRRRGQRARGGGGWRVGGWGAVGRGR